MELIEMAVKKEKKGTKTKREKNNESELSELRWSVVTFERCAAKNLSYEQAEQTLRELSARKISGLCIITDEAAEKVKSKK